MEVWDQGKVAPGIFTNFGQNASKVQSHPIPSFHSVFQFSHCCSKSDGGCNQCRRGRSVRKTWHLVHLHWKSPALYQSALWIYGFVSCFWTLDYLGNFSSWLDWHKKSAAYTCITFAFTRFSCLTLAHLKMILFSFVLPVGFCCKYWSVFGESTEWNAWQFSCCYWSELQVWDGLRCSNRC
jgi:hypothetical protein